MASIDGKFEIKVADNKKRVTANLSPAQGDGTNPNVEDILLKLESMGITTGIKHDNIRALCESQKPLRNIILADAISPQIGEKAKLETYFDLNTNKKALEKEDGSVDFRDLGEIPSASNGQKLYRRIPPTVGEPGIDVYGSEIPGIVGRDLKIVLGQGTKLDEEDTELVISDTDGEIVLKNGIVCVSQIHTVDGDIDYSTGNINFNGSVKINGTVKAGFRVEAESNIEISGNVEDAVIVGGNDVSIKGGFVGNGDGKIFADRDVYVKFVENQFIEAVRDIFIQGESYHATLHAGRSVVAKGPKTIIVGGHCEAKLSIEAGVFGSTAGANTEIKVGIDPKLAEQIKNTEEKILQSQESTEKLEKSVIFLYRQKIDGDGKLPSEKAELLAKLEKAKKELPDKIAKLQSTLESLLEKQKEVEKAFATANTAVYSKVQVYIGNQWLNIDDNLGPSLFKISGGEVIRLSK